MSFSKEVKKELTAFEYKTSVEKMSELSALVSFNGQIILKGNNKKEIEFSSDSVPIVRKVFSLFKELFSVSPVVLVSNSKNQKNIKKYKLKIEEKADYILNELGINYFFPELPNKILKKRENVISFLRGAFLASGSINSPKSKNYHLEIFTQVKELAEGLKNLINDLIPDSNVKIATRRNGFIVYLKDSSKIVDFLLLISASEMSFLLEHHIELMNLRNSANRLTNAEVANVEKTIVSSQEQIQQIKKIDKEIGLKNIPEKLQEIAIIRLENPDEPLSKLGQYVKSGKLSKSGVNHRINKIKKIYESLKNEF